MSNQKITCPIPGCGSVQCDPKDVSKTLGVKFRCKKCENYFYLKVEIPPEIATEGYKKPTVAKRGGSGAKAKGEEDKPVEAECDGSEPLKNSKHEKFIQTLCAQGKNANQAEAYVLAGYKPKDADSAKAAASKLLTDINVARRLAWIQKQCATKNILTREQALEILTQRAFADLADYVSVDIDGCLFIKFDENMPNTKAIKKVKTKTVTDENGNEVQAIMFGELELHDSVKAIERIAKMQGWDKPEKHEHSFDGLDEVFEEAKKDGLKLPRDLMKEDEKKK